MSNQWVSESRVTHHTSVPDHSVEDLYNRSGIRLPVRDSQPANALTFVDSPLRNAYCVTLAYPLHREMLNRGTNAPPWHGCCSYYIVKSERTSAPDTTNNKKAWVAER